jgi:sugar/nucleoside kinase (ribokinase family)
LASASFYDIGGYDLVIVTDFGHGLLTKELIARLTKEARFLAVNAQTNSTNYGFNLITKYPRADFIVIDEMEARLAAHDKDSDIEDVILKLGYKNIIVTLGAHGAIGFDGAFERQPAITDKVVDTMGAGDAFLCVSAPFAAAGAFHARSREYRQCRRGAKVGIVGHRESITKEHGCASMSDDIWGIDSSKLHLHPDRVAQWIEADNDGRKLKRYTLFTGRLRLGSLQSSLHLLLDRRHWIPSGSC